MQEQPLLPSSSSTTTTENSLSIDGSIGEGGGQILRNSISYANILNRSIHIHQIRANRSKPGLKAQHLTGLELTSQITGGTLEGGALDSTEISFRPLLGSKDDQKTTFLGDTGTAGSIVLLLQAALPVALLGGGKRKHKKPYKLILKGGTNAEMAPQLDYWEHVFWPILEQHVFDKKPRTTESSSHPTTNPQKSIVQLRILRRGYYPRGGGEVHVNVHPYRGKYLNPIQLTERGQVSKVFIRAFHAGRDFSQQNAQQMADAAHDYLCRYFQEQNNNAAVKVEVVKEEKAVGSGLGILIVAETTTGCRFGGSALGRKPKKRKQASSTPSNFDHVGIRAVKELCDSLTDGGCVDEWLQDQLILYMALAKGSSEVMTGSLTLHTQTAIWVAQLVTNATFQVIHLQPSGNVDISESLKQKSSVVQPTSEQNLLSCEYGQRGRMTGRFLIRCHGIGYLNP